MTKMLGQTSGVSYSQQNKEKSSYERTFGNELVSILNEMLYSSKEYCIYVRNILLTADMIRLEYMLRI